MKKIALVLAIVMLVCLLAGCSDGSPTAIDPENGTQVEVYFADLTAIPGHADLYYSVNTHTVYYIYNSGAGQCSVGYMAPYIKNGYFCEYRNGEITEVIPTVQTTN